MSVPRGMQKSGLASPPSQVRGILTPVGLRLRLAACVVASASAATLVAEPAFPEAHVAHTSGWASKKGDGVDDLDDLPVLATLDQVHTGECVALDAASPDDARFEALLADRITGTEHALDPALLGLLRTLAASHPGSRIEIVSGYRSPKLNEMLRKKGHHVSSHSQHSLGHACDFRIVPPGADLALDPRDVEREIRATGWTGGVGVYPTKDDWFVHADVGPTRHWVN
jgi:uncharacterized protein YcbK (DUF882 family)